MSTAHQAQITQQYCTFTVADHLFGIEVTRVQEVLRKQEITFVPKAPKEIVGLLNLRGQILPAIDLRTRLGFPEHGALQAVNVICVSSDGPVDLLADKIGDVLTVNETSWAPVPDSMDGRLRQAVLCIHKLKDQLLLVLDPDIVAELES
jgi:purine-binding chemotaxis protein CheW